MANGGTISGQVPGDGRLPLDEETIFVSEYDIEGNTVIDAERLQAVLQPYTGRGVSTQELLELREQLTFLYVNAGYVNSGFVIPGQKVEGGVVRIRAVEGVLEGVEVTGLKRVPESLIRQRIDTDSRPFNALDLQRQLQHLLRDPRIERVNSELQPGIAPGRAWLSLHVTEARPWNLTLLLDNHRPPSIGSFEGRLRVQHFSFTGRADEFLYDLGVSEGLTDLVLAYAYPVAVRTMLGLGFQANNAVVIEEPFDQIDITSLTNDVAMYLEHAFVNRLDRTVEGRIRVEKRHGETELLDIPFSFAPGVINGRSDVTVARLQGSWQERTEDAVMGGLLQLSRGFTTLGATENPKPLPDSRFTAALAQLQYARSVFDESELRLRGAAQLAFDPLLPIEKFVLGGADTVRGYRQNQLVRDNGWFVSAEFQTPLSRRHGLRGAVFAEYGRAWNESSFRLPGNKTLSSLGLGLVWRGRTGWRAQLYWGYALQDVPDPSDHDLQDEGITLLVSWTP